jgi:hypothetical protein
VDHVSPHGEIIPAYPAPYLSWGAAGSPNSRKKRGRDKYDKPTVDAPAGKGKGSPYKGKGKGGKGKPTEEAWEVTIGASAPKCKILETDTHVTVNGKIMSKAAMASVCECGPSDKCWPVAMSVQPWPQQLKLCPCPTKVGHEKYDSSHHIFTAKQLAQIRGLMLASKP